MNARSSAGIAADGACERMPRRRLARADGQHEQCLQRADPAREDRDRVERRVVGPVDVLERRARSAASAARAPRSAAAGSPAAAAPPTIACSSGAETLPTRSRERTERTRDREVVAGAEQDAPSRRGAVRGTPRRARSCRSRARLSRRRRGRRRARPTRGRREARSAPRHARADSSRTRGCERWAEAFLKVGIRRPCGFRAPDVPSTSMLNFREELLAEQRRALERRLSLAYPPRERRRRSESWWKRRHRRDCDSHSPENDGGTARLPPQWPASSPR